MATIWMQAVFVAAFVTLVVGVLLWLRSADRKLAQLVQSAQTMELHARAAAIQVGDLVQSTEATMQTVQSQLEGVTKLMEATKRIGSAAEQASSTVSRLANAWSETAEQHISKAGGKYKHQIANALDWAEIGCTAWQFWQTKRKENASPVCSKHDEGHDTKE
ncbi:hypothetical protein Back11_04440 [Paenibacillus baekrokdamisoli]|uniref:Uncharacterized protein n=1 Tax=Paenibacillus baekrokdamisoli TaxID=1712516 RepID=A0A3G9J7W4_9BACL|nr:DUF948 domain-containing protein [Paenibacillus baekrokdamisoli]MBB3067717.1 uncharacterized protein YoxC [Paenibacillus baekrokdamisoli]BBH19099.1 hypothetical protein Back11_04440 [Paenibacillus baekrokdamisoli]